MLTGPSLARKRRYSAGFIEPHPGVELLRKQRFAVVAPSLGVRAIDDADEPLEPRHLEAFTEIESDLALTQVEQEPIDAAIMRHPLMAFGE
jgi:hypothetical protein